MPIIPTRVTAIIRSSSSGQCTVRFPANQYPHGPMTVIVNTWDSPAGDKYHDQIDLCVDYVRIFQ